MTQADEWSWVRDTVPDTGDSDANDTATYDIMIYLTDSDFETETDWRRVITQRRVSGDHCHSLSDSVNDSVSATDHGAGLQVWLHRGSVTTG